MTKQERYFLNGIVRAKRPLKILEAGVSSGGSSAIILNAISDIDSAELYSVDYSERAYRHMDKLSGFLVDEKFPELKNKWHIFRGGDVSRFIEEIGGDIDLFLLDTVHTHPWETLNFLCVLPFLKPSESWTVLHDISIFSSPDLRYCLACRYLFSSVVSDEKIVPASDNERPVLPNIGAFKVSEVTAKYADNLFETLVNAWNMQISERDISDITKIISKYYSPEQYKFFCEVLKFQEYIFKNPATMRSRIFGMIKQHANPRLFKSLKGIRDKFRF